MIRSVIISRTKRPDWKLIRWFGLWLVIAGTVTAGFTQTYMAPKFLYYLTYPRSEYQVMDPVNVYFEPRHEEIYVADTRNSRVVIFDNHGRYTFDFYDPEHLAGARQLAVDSLGRIYVLRAEIETVVSVFDYNGEYLREMLFTDPRTDSILSVAGVMTDSRNRLYILSVNPAHIYSYTTDGELIDDFALFAGDTSLSNQQAFGTPALADEKLLIPLPMIPTVARYTTDGQLVDYIGFGGGGAGELAFPAAVAGDAKGNVYVLDKHRHTVLVFGKDGKFRWETGGRGTSPGWFYHPTTFTVDDSNEAIVGQTYMGRIQAISLAGPKR